jgi:hypothetical protein
MRRVDSVRDHYGAIGFNLKRESLDEVSDHEALAFMSVPDGPGRYWHLSSGSGAQLWGYINVRNQPSPWILTSKAHLECAFASMPEQSNYLEVGFVDFQGRVGGSLWVFTVPITTVF